MRGHVTDQAGGRFALVELVGAIGGEAIEGRRRERAGSGDRRPSRGCRPAFGRRRRSPENRPGDRRRCRDHRGASSRPRRLPSGSAAELERLSERASVAEISKPSRRASRRAEPGRPKEACRACRAQGKPAHGARHTGRARTGGVFGEELAVATKIHRRGRGGRRGFTEVECANLFGSGVVGDEKAAAAEISGGRMRHRQRQGGRDGRVDRVAAAPQHVTADLRRVLLLGHDDMTCKNAHFGYRFRIGDRGDQAIEHQCGDESAASVGASYGKSALENGIRSVSGRRPERFRYKRRPLGAAREVGRDTP